MILVIDNYDSFTYNLVQYIGEIRPDIEVVRNDAFNPRELLAKKPSHIILSPGPCTPNEAGVSVEMVKAVPASIPLLGVCLGHQSIGQAFGGKVVRCPHVMHGKVSTIHHQASPLFAGLPPSFIATRYHSLMVEKKGLPGELKVIATSDDDLIMGLQHVEKPIFGIQFHPESILTEPGKKILGNFLKMKPESKK